MSYFIIECLVCGERYASKESLIRHYEKDHPKPPAETVAMAAGPAAPRRVAAVEDFATIGARLRELSAKPRQEPQVDMDVEWPEETEAPAAGPGGQQPDILGWWDGSFWEMKPISKRAIATMLSTLHYPPHPAPDQYGYFPYITSHKPLGHFRSTRFQEATKGFIFQEVPFKC